ncbi:MAG: tRNA (adenosine(37)-N6)-threonylcarbamoyltransferase complex ATPase subunit type 1 TsaE [Sneathiellales bacterium]|nr:tRNA (adenosine(37)-N6)-threonylcarbamoyltransferase complex ATPase subunit type 1 TsaE [Sneathiellales bacterium]
MPDHSPFLSVDITSEMETAAFAERLSAFVKKRDVLTLNGTLGAGKTAFARAFIRSVCGSEIEVPSPTFNLLLLYDSPKGPIYHYDFYRLEDPEEVWELDVEDAYEEGITLMEWVERLEDLGPEDPLDIQITFPEEGPEKARIISLFGSETWQNRLKDLVP